MRRNARCSPLCIVVGWQWRCIRHAQRPACRLLQRAWNDGGNGPVAHQRICNCLVTCVGVTDDPVDGVIPPARSAHGVSPFLQDGHLAAGVFVGRIPERVKNTAKIESQTCTAALSGRLALLCEGKACSHDERCWQNGCAQQARQYRCKSRYYFYHFVPLTLLLFVALLLLLPAALRGLPGLLVLGKSAAKQLVAHRGCPACPQAGHTG